MDARCSRPACGGQKSTCRRQARAAAGTKRDIGGYPNKSAHNGRLRSPERVSRRAAALLVFEQLVVGDGAQHPRGGSHHHHPGGHVTQHQGACSHEGFLADLDPRQQRGAAADAGAAAHGGALT